MTILTGDEAVEAWRAEEARTQQGEALSFGQEWLTKAVGKLLPGSMITVGAETNVGKTFYGLDIAARCGVPALIFSAEDPAEEYGRRFSLLDQRSRERLYLFFPPLPKTSLCLDAMEEAHEQGCRLLVADYLQTIRYDGDSPHWKRGDEIRLIVSDIKGKCRELGWGLVMLSQLRRPAPEEPRTPTLRRLKESGDIENMSEYVVLLSEVDGKVKARLAKSKNSRKGQSALFTRGDGGILSEEVTHDDLFD